MPRVGEGTHPRGRLSKSVKVGGGEQTPFEKWGGGGSLKFLAPLTLVWGRQHDEL